jgi:histidinol dehydrogenase
MRLNRNLDKVLSRKTEASEDVTKSVTDILSNVRRNGIQAVREYCEKFDGYRGTDFLVTDEEINDAVARTGDDVIKILKRAKAQIELFHKQQVTKPWHFKKDGGAILGQIVRPIQRVALYVPGGTAAYPSTLLMNAVPAMIAGVPEMVIFTPVKSDGKVNDIILAAAWVCDIKTIYKIGGAQAIAAAAYGVDGIARVNKIVGPGNIFVATAKRMVYGEVDIDMVAGPSDILIIADEKANPKYIAADLMGQAEHDTLASSILVTTSEELIKQVESEIDRQIIELSRPEIIKQSLENYGAAILAKDLPDAFNISNNIAPEHLEILTTDPGAGLALVENAGSVFLGEFTPEALGDYMSGTNHVLPTNGTAKFYSPLGVTDFVKSTQYSYYPRKALALYRDDVIKFAELEGLTAHANSVKVRFED